jgi:hypothetical protein
MELLQADLGIEATHESWVQFLCIHARCALILPWIWSFLAPLSFAQLSFVAGIVKHNRFGGVKTIDIVPCWACDLGGAYNQLGP